MKTLRPIVIIVIFLIFIQTSCSEEDIKTAVEVSSVNDLNSSSEVNLEDWSSFTTLSSTGLIEGDDVQNASLNTSRFNEFISVVLDNPNYELSSLKLKLPSGIFYFHTLDIAPLSQIEGIQLVGEGRQNTIIKIKQEVNGSNGGLHISNLKNFVISDFTIENIDGNEGGLHINNREDNNVYTSEGLVENVEIIEANNLSCVVEGENVSYIQVKNCIVRNQKVWNGSESKAMFLAGEGAEFVTFESCQTFSSLRADHYDTDNAQFVKYINCTADGTGSSRGVGFWNEGEGTDDETSSFYTNCTTINTWGGLGVTEKSLVVAQNMHFINSAGDGWTIISQRSDDSYLSLDGIIIDNVGIDSEAKNMISGYRKGGIHIESPIQVTNCVFIGMPEQTSDISFYTTSSGSNIEERTIISNCEFERGILYRDDELDDEYVMGHITITNNIFPRNASITLAGWCEKVHFDINDNTFVNLGVSINAHVEYFNLSDNKFIKYGGYSEEAIITSSRLDFVQSGSITSNFFEGYNHVFDFGSITSFQLSLSDNEYFNCINYPTEL